MIQMDIEEKEKTKSKNKKKRYCSIAPWYSWIKKVKVTLIWGWLHVAPFKFFSCFACLAQANSVANSKTWNYMPPPSPPPSLQNPWKLSLPQTHLTKHLKKLHNYTCWAKNISPIISSSSTNISSKGCILRRDLLSSIHLKRKMNP